MAHTTGTWDFACDSYGKVRHSRKACVYASVKGPDGDRLVTLAARIPSWADARLMAAAPDMLAALQAIETCLRPDDNDTAAQAVRAAIAKAAA